MLGRFILSKMPWPGLSGTNFVSVNVKIIIHDTGSANPCSRQRI